MHIFMKSHFLRSMLKGIEHESKSNGLGRRKGSKNQWNLDASTHRKSIQKFMDFEVEISKNHEKNASENDVFFDCVFLSILRGFGEGFGTVLGGDLDSLGLSLAVFWPLFLRLCAQEGLRGPKRRPRVLLGSILDGFRTVLGGMWEHFGAQN